MNRKLPLVHFVEWKKVNDADLEKVLNDLLSWGVTDIVAHPVWGLRDQREPGFMDKITRLIAKTGLNTPACHAFWGDPYDLFQADEERRREAMKEHARFLRQLAPLGVKTYTLHLGGAGPTSSELKWQQIRRSVDELLPAAEETGIALALENSAEPMNDLRRLAALGKEYAHPRIGFCFDTGHANCYAADGLFPTLALMRENIVTCHMHDNYGSFDDHDPPGGGNIDWTALIPALKDCPRMLHAETESGDWSRPAWGRFVQVWK